MGAELHATNQAGVQRIRFRFGDVGAAVQRDRDNGYGQNDREDDFQFFIFLIFFVGLSEN
jgi:hypothetical protein